MMARTALWLVGLSLGLLMAPVQAATPDIPVKDPCDLSDDAKAMGVRIINATLADIAATDSRDALKLISAINDALLPPGCTIENIKNYNKEGKYR